MPKGTIKQNLEDGKYLVEINIDRDYFEEQITKIETRIDDLQADMDEFQGEVDNIQTEIDNLKQQIDLKQDFIRVTNIEAANLRDQIFEAQKELSEYKQKVGDLNDELNDLTGTTPPEDPEMVEENKTEIQENQDRFDEINAWIQDCTQKIQNRNESFVTLSSSYPQFSAFRSHLVTITNLSYSDSLNLSNLLNSYHDIINNLTIPGSPPGLSDLKNNIENISLNIDNRIAQSGSIENDLDKKSTEIDSAISNTYSANDVMNVTIMEQYDNQPEATPIVNNITGIRLARMDADIQQSSSRSVATTFNSQLIEQLDIINGLQMDLSYLIEELHILKIDNINGYDNQSDIDDKQFEITSKKNEIQNAFSNYETIQGDRNDWIGIDQTRWRTFIGLESDFGSQNSQLFGILSDLLNSEKQEISRDILELSVDPDTLENYDTEIRNKNDQISSAENDVNNSKEQITQWETELQQKEETLKQENATLEDLLDQITDKYEQKNDKELAKRIAESQKKNCENFKSYLRRKMPDNDPQATGWCADYTVDLDLGDEVGIVQIGMEYKKLGWNIYPGYNDKWKYDRNRDKVFMPLKTLNPYWRVFDYHVFNSVQKFYPDFRYGRMTAIDYDNDTCDIWLVTTHESSIKNFSIDKEKTFSDVPIEYMECNAEAFREAYDNQYRVLVKFEDRKWENPKVVGFEEEPVPCAWEPFSKSICSSNIWWTEFSWNYTFPGQWCETNEWAWNIEDSIMNINLTNISQSDIDAYYLHHYGFARLNHTPIFWLYVALKWHTLGRTYKDSLDMAALWAEPVPWGHKDNIKPADIMEISIPDYYFSGDTVLFVFLMTPDRDYVFIEIKGSGSRTNMYHDIVHYIEDGYVYIDLTEYLTNQQGLYAPGIEISRFEFHFRNREPSYSSLGIDIDYINFLAKQET